MFAFKKPLLLHLMLKCGRENGVWGGEMFFTPGSHHSQGLITLLSKNLDVTSIDAHQMGDRILSASLSYNEQNITVLNVYGPNNDKINKGF